MTKLLEKVKTKKNNEVRLFSVEPSFYEKTLLIIGVMHGDEWQGEPVINRLMSLEQTKNRVLFIPCLNPDGKQKNTRQNADKVDINRNFPTKNWIRTKKNKYWGGEFPSSEIETSFLIDIIDKYKPDAILTLHTPYRVVNYDGPAFEIAQKFAQLNGYPLEEDIGYPTPGSFGTYCGKERNIPTITLEFPDEEDIEKLWIQNQKAFEYFMQL